MAPKKTPTIRCLYDELVALDDLKSHPKNRNKHPDDQIARLAKVLAYQGFRYPVKVSKRSGFVTSGHGRIEAARLNGWPRVPVNFQDYESDEQEYADVQADNAIASWAELDFSGINDDLGDLGPDFDIEMLGIKNFVIEPAELEPQSDEDDVGEVPEEPKTKLGDIYKIGRHRLMCGDSTSIDAVDGLMNGENAGLVFTDPPYGVNFQSGMSKGGTATRFDRLKNDDKILDVFPVVWSAMADNTAAFVWTSHQVYPQWREQFSQAYKHTLIWHKPGGGIGDLNGNYATDYEMCLFCVKGRPKFYGKRGMAVWTVSKDRVLEYQHPTQKPVELAERAIEDFCAPSGVVLDLFGGSGSTLIACEKTGRKAYLMELDPKYCDVIVARWEKYTAKKAELING